jgi:hypothetical protein
MTTTRRAMIHRSQKVTHPLTMSIPLAILTSRISKTLQRSRGKEKSRSQLTKKMKKMRP